jgi:Methyltransferase domain
MSRKSSAPIILCALVVTVCVILVSQRECTVAPIRSLTVGSDHGGASDGMMALPSPSLAHEQSFGYFDDITDQDWRERQRRAYAHKHYRSAGVHQVNDDTDPSRWYMLNYFPMFSCPNQERIGGAGEGAKWVCDPLRLKKQKTTASEVKAVQATTGTAYVATPRKAVALPAPDVDSSNSNKCLVYSVGCSGNYDFEDGLVELLGAGTCEIHVFDLSQDYTRPGDAHTNDIHFHYWGLKSSYDKSGLSSKYTYKTLHETMQELGHTGRTVDLFKIDCEGCTYLQANHQLNAAYQRHNAHSHPSTCVFPVSGEWTTYKVRTHSASLRSVAR